MEFATSLEAGKECSMCGDVGFSSELLQCTKCSYRWQHSYCSKLYPEITSSNWVCDWCFAAASKGAHTASPKEKGKKLMAGRKNFHQHQHWQFNSTSGKHAAARHEWDALEFLLEVAESCASQTSDGDSPCCGVVERQACSSKRTSARKLSLKKHQKWGLVSEKMSLRDTKLSVTIPPEVQFKSSTTSSRLVPPKVASPANASKTRYKLLADV